MAPNGPGPGEKELREHLLVPLIYFGKAIALVRMIPQNHQGGVHLVEVLRMQMGIIIILKMDKKEAIQIHKRKQLGLRNL